MSKPNTSKKSTANTDTNMSADAAPANNTAPDAPVASAPRSISEASNELKGTPAELVAKGVRLNGRLLAVSDIASLRKFHYKTVLDSAGYVEKVPGTKGKPAEIVQLLPAPGFQFSVA